MSARHCRWYAGLVKVTVHVERSLLFCNPGDLIRSGCPASSTAVWNNDWTPYVTSDRKFQFQKPAGSRRDPCRKTLAFQLAFVTQSSWVTGILLAGGTFDGPFRWFSGAMKVFILLYHLTVLWAKIFGYLYMEVTRNRVNPGDAVGPETWSSRYILDSIRKNALKCKPITSLEAKHLNQ